MHRADVVVRGAAQMRRFAAGGIHEFVMAAGDRHRLDHQAHSELGGNSGSRYARGCRTSRRNGIGK